ncbi:hypothetical protein OPT61_g1143 [Boeremia exigua]|uniref:Uncharacterized protein n=1 Tax=Boeremia exigua TaxID=749465 RepID=A0ACC2IR76_9PLEO|nr:hypothetical protein OPT61_g1143 [Boeremia exigua]
MSALPNPEDIRGDDKRVARDQHEEHEPGNTGKPGGNNLEGSLTVSRGAIRVPSPDPSLLSIDDSNNIRYGRNPDYFPDQDDRIYAAQSPAPPRTRRGRLWAIWYKNKGLFLVLVSQFFGTLMNITTRLLEMEGNNDSLLYLPLADATVITFLAPSLACWACSYLINEPFTRMEQIAAYVSLFGVVLIARPMSLFAFMAHSNESALPTTGESDAAILASSTADPQRLATEIDAVTPAQRASAVGVALLGVLGAAGAYTTIRWIGKRAHPLISVNYFATWCTIVSILMMVALPGVGILFPRSPKDWLYLMFLGVSGFIMQFLLAAGLQYEKSSRATNMVYVQMLFALSFDKLIWGTTPGALSIVGSSLILGSAIYVAMHKEAPKKEEATLEPGDQGEGVGLMVSEPDVDQDDDGQSIPLAAVRG